MADAEGPMSTMDVAKGLGSVMATLRGGAPADEPEETPDEVEALDNEQADTEPDDEAADELEDESDESTDEPEFSLSLMVDGEDYLVTDRDEATRLAQLGKHFTKKNEALIEREQVVERERAEVAQTREQYVAALDDLIGYLEAPIGDAPDERDYTDRANYLEADKAYNQALQAVQATKAERERVRREQAEQQNTALAKWRTEQIQAAAAKVPDWSDTETWTTEREAMREYAQSVGYTAQELSVSLDQLIVDHRQLLVLRDAMRYRRAAEAGATEVKKTRSKEAAPGSGAETRTDGTTRRRKELTKRVRAGDKEAQLAAATSLIERQKQLTRKAK